MVDVGNDGFPDFHEAAGNDFQLMWRTCKKSREAAISRFPRPFSVEMKAHRDDKPHRPARSGRTTPCSRTAFNR
jgi:hypothetical protein